MRSSSYDPIGRLLAIRDIASSVSDRFAFGRAKFRLRTIGFIDDRLVGAVKGALELFNVVGGVEVVAAPEPATVQDLMGESRGEFTLTLASTPGSLRLLAQSESDAARGVASIAKGSAVVAVVFHKVQRGEGLDEFLDSGLLADNHGCLWLPEEAEEMLVDVVAHEVGHLFGLSHHPGTAGWNRCPMYERFSRNEFVQRRESDEYYCAWSMDSEDTEYSSDSDRAAQLAEMRRPQFCDDCLDRLGEMMERVRGGDFVLYSAGLVDCMISNS